LPGFDFFRHTSFRTAFKKGKKEWKKKAKEYSKNPAELKTLIEAKQASENDNATLKGQGRHTQY